VLISKLSKIRRFLIALGVVISFSWTAGEAASIEVPRMSVEQAKLMNDNPDVVFIDLRTAKSWWRSATKIRNAVREEPNAVKKWASKYTTKDQTLILYCA
jgi:hypothetical protein